MSRRKTFLLWLLFFLAAWACLGISIITGLWWWNMIGIGAAVAAVPFAGWTFRP